MKSPLTPASAALDRGVDAGVETDFEGDVRPAGCCFDIGADELETNVTVVRIFLPIVVRNY